VPPGSGYGTLAAAYEEAHGVSGLRPATVRRAVYELRQGGLTDWGGNDARLRGGSLTSQLLANAARQGFGPHVNHSILQYLRIIDRLEAGLPVSSDARGAETFAAHLRSACEVVDLREDGEPYLRAARPWEAGHLVVQSEPSGSGA
jgi:hypothetical protein